MLLAVLGLHLAVMSLFFLAQRGPKVRSIAPEPRRTSVRLIPAAPNEPLAGLDQPPATEPRSRPIEPAPPGPSSTDRRAARRVISNLAIAPAPASVNALTSASATATASASASASASAAASAPASAPPLAGAVGATAPWSSLLDSAATRRAIHESALAPREDKERKPRLTPEAKMTQTFGGDGRLVEQDLGNGRRRYWQNGKCTETNATRASALFPEDTLPRPRLVGACP